MVEKLEENRPVGKPIHRWDNDIETDLKGMAWEGVDQVHLAEDRVQWLAVANRVMDIPDE
jgi:hypothetical protein